jgi:hypothetical protein
MSKINYLQPIYLNYNKKFIENITGYVMPFPNLDTFNLLYGEHQEKAPTNSLVDTIRLLLPQIRVINNLKLFDGKPNPAAFFAYEPIPPEILALIFRRWVEACYPEADLSVLLPLCEANHFQWTDATPEQLEYWAPSWACALELTKHEYKLGNDSFKFLFGPGHKTNTVEIVSWPPFATARGYRASIALTISTQSDLDPKKINLHFGMKRWVIKQGEKTGVRLEKGTTHFSVRQLRSWLGDYDLLEPNAFTVLKANYRRLDDGTYIPQWKNQQVIQILELLSVNIPDIINILANPLNFIETDQMDLLIPARAYQKVGWGKGLPFADQRNLLKQIRDILRSNTVFPEPWQKVKLVGDLKKSIKERFQDTPTISKPSQGQLPNINSELQDFLVQRAKNLTIIVRWRTEEVRDALVRVSQHYFGDKLNLELHPSEGLADPISSRQLRRTGKMLPDTSHIEQWSEKNKQVRPTPVIVEILLKDHPSYHNERDPKHHIKSILPKYNLIPQCIVSSEMGIDSKTQEIKIDEDLQKSIDNRALNTILDAILPFDCDYPLSNFDGNGICKDNTVYAGFHLIRRNSKTANKAFSEPVLVVIYHNEVRVLLSAIDLQWRSMPDAICELATQSGAGNNSDRVIDNMLSTLTQSYSNADDIYLFVHAQNARSYWNWIQDSRFDPATPPSNKIHIIRIRDQENNEVPQAYGLQDRKTFIEDPASFAQGIFIPNDCDLQNLSSFTQTVLSVAEKPETNKNPKQMSRFNEWSSRGYEVDVDENGNKIVDENGKPVRAIAESGKRIQEDILHEPLPSKDWNAPQPRAHNILATPAPENFILHHAITHDLRSRHWWTSAECEYPVTLSLAAKFKEWCFNRESEIDL